MDQLDLFAEPPDDDCPICHGLRYVMVKRACACQDESLHENTPGKAHTGAHATEKLAALKAAPRTGTQRWRVLVAIRRAYVDGRVGLNDEEIGASPGIHDNAHRTRRNELVMGEWVEASGVVRPTASDSEAIVWTLTDKGRDWFILNPGEAA